MGNSTTRFRFTKQSLAALEPTDRTYQVRDTGCRGLILLVTPNSSRTFYRYGRVDGKVRRVKIGAFPAVSVPTARKKCDVINGNLAVGKAPESSSRGGITFGDLWRQYWEEHALINKSETSRNHDEWQWKKLLKPNLGSRKVSHIKKSDILSLQGKIAKGNGKVTANRMLSLVKKIFNHAIDSERLESSPASRVKKFPERSRERFLQGDELPRFFKALDNFDNQDAADFWRICLFTGARQANVLAMQWSEIDLATAVWTIPKTKSGTSQQIPLASPAVEIIEDRHNSSPFVFRSHGKTGHMTRPGKAWDRLLEQAGLEDLTMHDLRRSLGSYQAATGASELVIGKTLGHAPGSRATAVYARLNLESVRDSVAAATDAMLAAANPKRRRR